MILRTRVGLREAALSAAALAGLVYLNALGNGFALDDQHIIVENEAIHTLHGLAGALAAPYWPGDLGRVLGLWRPLSSLTLGVVWLASGGAPVAFHVLNLVLHAAVTGAVVLLLGRMLPPVAALLGGMIFAVHPVHVEAVANVVGVAELLSTLLFLVGCLLWMDGSPWPEEATAAESPHTPDTPRSFGVPGPGRLLLLVVVYAGAFLTKEGAVVLPAVLPLLDAVRRPIPLRQLGRYLRPRLASFAVLALAALAVLALRFNVLWSVANPLPPPGAALLLQIPRIWTVAQIWPEYFRLLLFPVSLSSDYAPELIPVVTVWTLRGLLGVALALGTLAAALLTWRRAPSGDPQGRMLSFGVLWFVVTVLPVSNVLFLAGVLLAERNLYLPSVGFAALAGWALHRAMGVRPRLTATLTAALLVLLAGRVLARNPAWSSTDTITTRLIMEHPQGGRAQWALGGLQESTGALEEADLAYRKAVDGMDGDYALLVDLGRRFMNRGKSRTAAFLLGEALKAAPASPNAVQLLAVLHAQAGSTEETVRWARLATTLDPRDVVSWHILSSSLEAEGRINEAIPAREEVIRRGEGERWQQWLSLASLLGRARDSARSARALDSARVLAGASLEATVDSLYLASQGGAGGG